MNERYTAIEFRVRTYRFASPIPDSFVGVAVVDDWVIERTEGYDSAAEALDAIWIKVRNNDRWDI